MSLGKKIRNRIEEVGFTQTKVADAIGVSPSRLSNYLSDKREPDFAVLEKLANLLGVDMNYFSDSFKGDYVLKDGQALDLLESAGALNYDVPAGTYPIPLRYFGGMKRKKGNILITEDLIPFREGMIAIEAEQPHNERPLTLKQGSIMFCVPATQENAINKIVVSLGRNGYIGRFLKVGKQKLVYVWRGEEIRGVELKPDDYIVVCVWNME